MKKLMKIILMTGLVLSAAAQAKPAEPITYPMPPTVPQLPWVVVVYIGPVVIVVRLQMKTLLTRRPPSE